MDEILVALLGGLALVLTTIVGVWLAIRSTQPAQRRAATIHAHQASRIEDAVRDLRREVAGVHAELDRHVEWEEGVEEPGKYDELEGLLIALLEVVKAPPS